MLSLLIIGEEETLTDEPQLHGVIDTADTPFEPCKVGRLGRIYWAIGSVAGHGHAVRCFFGSRGVLGATRNASINDLDFTSISMKILQPSATDGFSF
jgi:hypothetical protein